MWIIDYGQSTKNKVVTVVGESVPHLDLGAKRDFKSILVSNGYWDESCWSERGTYRFPGGTIVEFVSFDKFGKAHGPRRDVLFINEANNIPYNIADQLITRTRDVVFLDWNPTSEFWFYTEMFGRRDDIDFMGEGGNYPPLTYLDNEALEENSRREIESHKNNNNWWRVYGLGLLGDVAARIFSGWNIIDDIPHEARLERYGLDFGWSPDPAACVAIYYYNGGYIYDEIFYRLEMSNREIAESLKNLPPALVIADSAEPKSINEVRMFGVNIQPCEKGADSKRYGITVLQEMRISVTKRSVNLLKEYRNYLWKTNLDGNLVAGETDPNCKDHLMDAIRYGSMTLAPIRTQEEYYRHLPSPISRPPLNPAL